MEYRNVYQELIDAYKKAKNFGESSKWYFTQMFVTIGAIVIPILVLVLLYLFRNYFQLEWIDIMLICTGCSFFFTVSMIELLRRNKKRNLENYKKKNKKKNDNKNDNDPTEEEIRCLILSESLQKSKLLFGSEKDLILIQLYIDIL